VTDAFARAKNAHAKSVCQPFGFPQPGGDMLVRRDHRMIEEDRNPIAMEYTLEAVLLEKCGDRRRIAVLEIDAIDAGSH